MIAEENSQKVNNLRRQRGQEKAKIQEAIFLSKKEEAKQAKMQMLQNKQRKNMLYSQIN